MFDKLRNNSKIVVYIVVAAFIVTGGLMGFGSYLSNTNSSSASNSSSPYIAEVNDKGITPQQYMNVLRNQAPQTQLSSSQIIPFRLNVLNSMIERQLLLDKADEMGIKAEVTDKEVNEKIDEILKNNDLTEEELSTRLKEQNSSLKQFKKDIKESLKVSSRLQKTIETSYDKVDVSEEEIKEAYEKSNKDKKLDEVRDQIKEQLLSNKQNETFSNWLENIKAESDIIINDPTLNAYYQLQNGKYDLAIELFNNLIETNSGPMIYTYLAEAYRGKENKEKVIETYQKALKEYPDNWELAYNFANYYRSIDEKENALAQYDVAAEKAGEQDIMAHYKLYMAYTAIDAKEKATKEMQTITEIQKKMQKQQQQAESKSTENEKQKSEQQTESEKETSQGDQDEN